LYAHVGQESGVRGMGRQLRRVAFEK
jgi:hypothetical protein